jgi:hypothetical protein
MRFPSATVSFHGAKCKSFFWRKLAESGCHKEGHAHWAFTRHSLVSKIAQQSCPKQIEKPAGAGLSSLYFDFTDLPEMIGQIPALS